MQAARDWSDCLEYSAATDVGMRRANNQDAHVEVLAPDLETWQRRGHLFAVCDGMGAHAAGELASEIAAEGIPHTYLKLRDFPSADAIRRSIEEVNNQIHTRGQANLDFQGMGTTASTLLLLPQGAIVAHVGDSRVYRLRGARLEQLTFDHSLVWEMSAAGQMPKDALPGFVPKNIITRSLGPHENVQVDLEGPFALDVGDTFLLCSDGLTGQVKDEELGAILQCMPPADAAQVLIDLANLRGGPDNITVIVVRVTGAAITVSNGRPVEPLTISAQVLAEPTAGKASNHSLWIAAAVCLLAAVGFGTASWTIPAVVAVGGAIALGLVAALSQLTATNEPQVQALPPGARLGRGPHVTIESKPNEQFVTELLSMIEQLRQAAIEERWAIDWSRLEEHMRQGRQAVAERDFAKAVHQYASALHFMMNQLRNQRPRAANGQAK
jgi:PPM family protein phosphatase